MLVKTGDGGCGGSQPSSQYDELAAAYPAKRSCLVFTKNSPLRKYCILIINSVIFDKFIFVVILCNCVTLALNSNRQDFSSTRLGKALTILDYVFIGIFTVEMILKVIGMGLVLDRGTYLRDGWNVLDFLVVVMGYVSLLSPSNLTAIRAFRAMRPLRTINRVKGMKILVSTMIGSMPLLLDVFLLCAFTFFVFSLVAVQLFSGVLRYRCGNPDLSGAYGLPDDSGGGLQLLANVSYVVPDEETEGMCSGRLSSEVVWYLVNGTDPTSVAGPGYAGRVCDDGMYCTLYGNPSYGLLSYDTILWSWLTVFQHITLSGWSDVMYMVMDAVNFWVWIFYVTLIIFGAFFMVNLALAVLAVKFSADRQEEREHDQEGEEQRCKEAAGVGQQEVAEGKAAGGWAEGPAAAAEVQGAEGAAVAASAAGGGGSGSILSSPTRFVAALKHRRKAQDDDDADTIAPGSPPPAHLGATRRLAWRLAVSRTLELTTAALILVNTAVMCINWYGMPERVVYITNIINYALTVYFAVEVGVRMTALGARFFRSGMNLFDLFVVVVSVAEMIVDLIPSVSGVGPLSVLRAFRLLRVFRLARSWRQLNAILSGMFRSVTASLSLVSLTALFVFVAALVGMQVFGYKFMFCDYVEGASAVCPPGQEVWGECPDHFYCYMPCTSDQYGSWLDAPGSFFNGQAYCDRFCATAGAEAADAAAAAAGATASSSAAVAADADAVGGCEYLAMVGKSQVPRAQFDNILWGMYTVFQVLTGENWNDIMLDAMRTVSPWASLYFVGVILIGNYLVFNLFIAILLDNLDLKIKEASVASAAASSRGGSRRGSGGGEGGGGGGGSSSKKGSRRPSRSPSVAVLARPQLEVGSVGAVTPARLRGYDGGLGGSGGDEGASPLPFRQPVFDAEAAPAAWGLESGPQLGTGTATAGSGAAGHLALPLPRPVQPWPLGPHPAGDANGVVICKVPAAPPPGPAAVAAGRDSGEAGSHFAADSREDPGLLLPLPPSHTGAARGCEAGGAALGGEYGPAAIFAAPAAVAPSRSPSAAELLVPAVEPPREVPRAAGPLAESVETAGARTELAPRVAAHAAAHLACGRSRSAAALLPADGPFSRARGPVAESTEPPAEWGGERRGAGLATGGLQALRSCPSPPPPPPPPPPTSAPYPPPWKPSPGSPTLPPCSDSSSGPQPAFQAPADQAAAVTAAAAAAAAVAAAVAAGSPPTGTGSASTPSCSDSAVLGVRPGCALAAAVGRRELSFSADDLRHLNLQHPHPHRHLPLASAMSSLSQHEQQQKQHRQQQLQPQHDQPHPDLNDRPPHHIPRVPLLGPSPSFLSKDRLRNVLQVLPLPSIRSACRADADAAALAPPGPPWRHVLTGRALLLFGPRNRLRAAAAAVVHNWWFESAILLFILASCVCLVLDAPSLDPASRLAAALRVMDYIFTAVFTVEALIKLITFGFAFTGRHAYVRSGWNLLDGAIVALGWALIIVEEAGVSGANNVKVLRVLRALRALRPLRAVHGFPGLKLVVNTLFAVLPGMAHVALVCVFFYLIFAILAVNLFKGKLYNCIDAASGERIDPFYVLPEGQVLTRTWCEAGSQNITQSAYFSGTNVTIPEYTLETQWINPTANFDNVGIAMLTLFQVATLSLWVDITFSAVDATGIDKQPLWNHSPWVVLVFVLFVVVCTFFVLNLFVGVTLDKFAEMHAAQDAPSVFLTPAQQSWVDTQRLLLRAEAGVRHPQRRPAGWLRGALYRVAASRGFEVAMMVVIAANVGFMAAVHWDMSPTWQAVMSYSNVAFTGLFVIEAAIKLVAFGPLGYFRDAWNCFDFFVVAVSVTSVALDFSNARAISFMPVLRVLRVVRVVRLIRHARGMQKLVHTLVTSLPALANVGGVMLIFFFMFAVIGVNLFAGIKQGEALDGHANFDTFPNAMLLLFRMLTGEGWDAIMQDCMATDGCVLVLQDINVTLPDPLTTTSLSPPPLDALYPPAAPLDAASAALAAATLVTLTGGTYLDPSDPLLASLPANATDNQCPLSPIAAIVYFPLFVVLCTFILLQLVIAVLLENLVEADEEEAEEEEEEGAVKGERAGGSRLVRKSTIDSFVAAWAAAAAEAAEAGEGAYGGGGGGGGWRRRRGLLHVSRLAGVLAASEPPLGARGFANVRQEVQQRLLRVRVPLYEGNEVSFIEVLHSLTGNVCGTALPPSERDKLNRQLSKRLPKVEPHTQYTAAHYHASMAVAAAVRGFMLRQKIREKEAALEAEEKRKQQEAQEGQARLLRQQRRAKRAKRQKAAAAGEAPTQPQSQQPAFASVSWLLWLVGMSRPASQPAPAAAAAPAAAPSSPPASFLSSPLRYLVGLPLSYLGASMAALLRGLLFGQRTGSKPAGSDPGGVCSSRSIHCSRSSRSHRRSRG